MHIKILGLLLSDLPGERELLSDLGSHSVITTGMGSAMTAVWLSALSRREDNITYQRGYHTR